MCTREGEECTPDEMGCGLYTGVRCDGGVWVFFEVGTGQCTGGSGGASDESGDTASVPCGDEVPAEGTPCEAEGEDCAPPAGACDGNVGAMCSAGHWTRYELDPMDCELDCAEICAATITAACSAGPADAEACASECEARRAGMCASVYLDAVACGPQPPSFTCDAAGRPSITGCEPQFEALYQCSE